MKLAKFIFLLLSILLVANLGVGGTLEKAIITDLAGRKVEVPISANRIVAIGPGALRLVCYVNGVDKVVGVENIEKEWSSIGRTYIMAYPELKKLPVIGQGGPDSIPDAEKLVTVNPDVIFVAYLVDKKSADELQAKTGIPVVVLSYGNLATIDEDIYKSINLIGKIIGQEKRAREVINYIKKTQRELSLRTKKIPDEKKLKVYVGALGMKGGHGIESTQAKYPPFAMINAKNVVDETGQRGSVMIEKEKLLVWDPDVIFIDLSNYNLVEQDYRKDPQFYQELKAVKNGQVYGQLPFNFYTTNIDTAIADAYWAGKVLFPKQFKDIEPIKKANEIYRFFLGKPLYDDLAKKYGGFTKLTIGGQ